MDEPREAARLIGAKRHRDFFGHRDVAHLKDASQARLEFGRCAHLDAAVFARQQRAKLRPGVKPCLGERGLLEFASKSLGRRRIEEDEAAVHLEDGARLLEDFQKLFATDLLVAQGDFPVEFREGRVGEKPAALKRPAFVERKIELRIDFGVDVVERDVKAQNPKLADRLLEKDAEVVLVKFEVIRHGRLVAVDVERQKGMGSH